MLVILRFVAPLLHVHPVRPTGNVGSLLLAGRILYIAPSPQAAQKSLFAGQERPGIPRACYIFLVHSLTGEKTLGDAIMSAIEHHNRHASVDDGTKVVHVQNVALADATQKQKPSPWTKNMFQVRYWKCRCPVVVRVADRVSLAVLLLAGCDLQLLHQRL